MPLFTFKEKIMTENNFIIIISIFTATDGKHRVTMATPRLLIEPG